ncbi:hypothetical protein ACOMHN_005079 [Nucella lapillus]
MDGEAESEIVQDLRSGSIRAGVAVRCSTVGHLGKARMRTLKMTLVIVSVFILCWTPYFLNLSLFWFHR